MIAFVWPFDEMSGGGDVSSVTPLFRYSNYAESVLWVAIGVYVVIRAARKGDVSRLQRVLAVALFAFGASDVVEANTGAWWRPIWLLFWKGGCLLVFLLTFLRFRRRRQSP